MTSNGQSFRTSATFVETNGASAAWLLTIPLLLTVATGVGLWLRHTRGSGAATTLAWSSVALLVVFSRARRRVGRRADPAGGAATRRCRRADVVRARGRRPAQLCAPESSVKLEDASRAGTQDTTREGAEEALRAGGGATLSEKPLPRGDRCGRRGRRDPHRREHHRRPRWPRQHDEPSERRDRCAVARHPSARNHPSLAGRAGPARRVRRSPARLLRAWARDVFPTLVRATCGPARCSSAPWLAFVGTTRGWACAAHSPSPAERSGT